MTRSEWQAQRLLMSTSVTLAATPPAALKNARNALRKRRLKRTARRLAGVLLATAAFLTTATSLSASL